MTMIMSHTRTPIKAFNVLLWILKGTLSPNRTSMLPSIKDSIARRTYLILAYVVFDDMTYRPSTYWMNEDTSTRVSQDDSVL